MDNELHVVVGGAGTIGRATIAALQAKNKRVVAVERSRTVEGIETRTADVLDAAQTKQSLVDATHVYLCAGLPYDSEIWQAQWPIIMQNAIDACAAIGAKLIFFDNVYLYSHPLPQPFTEDSPQQPSTKKGAVRKQIADMLLAAHAEGKVRAVIGRSADFYGPRAVNSLLYVAFLERMLRGKQPISVYRQHEPHTYAYTPDNGRALVQLALDDGAYGQAWHLPVGIPISVAEAAERFNAILDTHFAVQVIPEPIYAILRQFNKPMREIKEMAYQFNEPYLMSAQKFFDRYPDFVVTPYEEGFKAMIESFQNETN